MMRAQEPTLSRARQLARAAAAVALFACAAPAVAAPDWDIVGVRLGMTEAEVKAALKAFAPSAKITTYNSSFPYYDGVSNFQTPQFLNSVDVRVDNLGNGVKAWFSGPVGEARVIAVARRHFSNTNPPSLGQFDQSLTAKYGQSTGMYQTDSPTWEESGKPSCIRIRDQGSQTRIYLSGPLQQSAQTFNPMNDVTGDLEKKRGGLAKGLLPADLTTCGAFVFYNRTNINPVKMFYAGLFDVGAIVATERSRNAWVDQLQAEAVRKREGKGQAPRL